MPRTSAARVRQILIIICLLCTLVCSLIIMSLLGAYGRITYGRFLNRGCLLYMTMEGNVPTYNNGLCLFPIIAAAITAGLSLVFLIFMCVVLSWKRKFSPRAMSVSIIFLSVLLALLSFAVCAVIGLGLNRACRLLGDRIASCRTNKNFSALYGAQITAGIMGGLWLIIMFLEVFQLKNRTHHHHHQNLAPNTVGIAAQPTVVPSTKKSSQGISNSNISNPNPNSASTSSTHFTSAPTSAPAPAHVHYGGTYQQQQPEMASYQAYGNYNGLNQVQQPYYQPTSQLPYQQVQPMPQMQYQQVQPPPQTQGVYQPPPAPQSEQPLQLQQPYSTYSTPIAEPYPPQNVSADTYPPSSGAGSSGAF